LYPICNIRENLMHMTVYLRARFTKYLDKWRTYDRLAIDFTIILWQIMTRFL